MSSFTLTAVCFSFFLVSPAAATEFLPPYFFFIFIIVAYFFCIVCRYGTSKTHDGVHGQIHRQKKKKKENPDKTAFQTVFVTEKRIRCSSIHVWRKHLAKLLLLPAVLLVSLTWTLWGISSCLNLQGTQPPATFPQESYRCLTISGAFQHPFHSWPTALAIPRWNKMKI